LQVHLLSTSGNVVKTVDAGQLVIDTLKTSKKNYIDEFDNLTNTMKSLDNYKGDTKIVDTRWYK
jgi:hypothetical protein